MKNMIKSMVAILCLMGIVACNSGKSDNSDDPNAEVTDFAKHFASYVTHNQLDSIRAVYPEAEVVDSFALNYVVDSLRVEANEKDGSFIVKVGDGVDFVIAKDKDGKLSVVSSHGLAAFKKDDLEFAKTVGQYKEGLTDVQQARRMAVKEFKEGLAFSFAKDLNSKVKCGRLNREIKIPEFSADEGVGAVTVTNATGKAIDGSDYVIDIFADGQYGSGSYRQKGKTIPANGSVNIQFTYAGNSYPTGALLTFTVSDEKLFTKYFEAKGNEFDEFLKAHDLDLDAVAEGQKTADQDNNSTTMSKADEDAAVENLIRTFYMKYVFGSADFTAVAKKYCTARLLKKLQADYDFEDGGYAIWDFRSGEQDSIGKSEIKSVKRVREGLVYEVDMVDM